MPAVLPQEVSPVRLRDYYDGVGAWIYAPLRPAALIASAWHSLAPGCAQRDSLPLRPIPGRRSIFARRFPASLRALMRNSRISGSAHAARKAWSRAVLWAAQDLLIDLESRARRSGVQFKKPNSLCVYRLMKLQFAQRTWNWSGYLKINLLLRACVQLRCFFPSLLTWSNWRALLSLKPHILQAGPPSTVNTLSRNRILRSWAVT